jgi:FkbM family methyltransferase
MRFDGFRVHPAQASRRIFRALAQARGVRAKIDTVRCIEGWALTKFRRSASTSEVVIDFGDVKLSLDRGRAELIPYLEIWHEHSYDSVPGFSVDQPDCVVDVGANVGTFTLYQAICKKAKRIISFEPAPTVFPRLITNLRINGIFQVEPFNTAVGDSCGIVRFVERPMSINCQVVRNEEEKGSVEIPCVTLDSFLGHIPKIDLLKVDVEGFETEVFKGAQETLKRTERIVVEVTGDCNRKGVDDVLKLSGFELTTQNDDMFFYKRPDEIIQQART